MISDRSRFALALLLFAAFAIQAPFAFDGKGVVPQEGEIAAMEEVLDLDSGPDGSPHVAVVAAPWALSIAGSVGLFVYRSFPRLPGQGLMEAPQGTGPPKSSLS